MRGRRRNKGAVCPIIDEPSSLDDLTYVPTRVNSPHRRESTHNFENIICPIDITLLGKRRIVLSDVIAMARGDTTLSSWDAFTDTEPEPDDENGDNVDLNSLPENVRSLKLSQAADNEFVDDLFSTSDNKKSSSVNEEPSDVFANNPVKAIIPADPLAHVSLKCLKDCDIVAKKLSQKIEQSPAKSAVWLQFIDVLFQSCEKKFDLKDLQTLKRKVEQAIKNRESKQREVTFSKKKPNETTSKNYQDELDMLYGELSDDEEPFYYT